MGSDARAAALGVVALAAVLGCHSETPVETLRGYEVVSPTITLARQLIAQGLSETRSDAVVLIVNASAAGKAGEGFLNNCAALDDHRTIVCDSAFVAMLSLFAAFEQAQQPDEWDDFFAATFAEAFRDPVKLVGIADRVLPHIESPDARDIFRAYLSLVLLHEIGHLRSTLPRGTDASEIDADAFALGIMAQHPARLQVSVSLFQLFERYIRSMSALAIGQPGGRRGSRPDPSPQKLAEWQAVYKALSCPAQHPPFAVRLVHMIKDTRFEPVYLQDRQWFDAFVEAAKQLEKSCGQRSPTFDPTPPIEHDITGIAFTLGGQKVQMLDAGAPPRAHARYTWRAEVHEHMKRVVTVDGGRTYTTEFAVAAGRISDFEQLRSQCDTAEYGIRLAILKSDAGWIPTDGIVTWCLDPSGRMLRLTLANRMHTRPVRNSEQAAKLLADLSLSPNTVVFPDEPIGVGAQWTVEERAFGATVVTTNRLTARTGDDLEVESTAERWTIHSRIDLARPLASFELHQTSIEMTQTVFP